MRQVTPQPDQAQRSAAHLYDIQHREHWQNGQMTSVENPGRLTSWLPQTAPADTQPDWNRPFNADLQCHRNRKARHTRDQWKGLSRPEIWPGQSQGRFQLLQGTETLCKMPSVLITDVLEWLQPDKVQEIPTTLNIDQNRNFRQKKENDKQMATWSLEDDLERKSQQIPNLSSTNT